MLLGNLQTGTSPYFAPSGPSVRRRFVGLLRAASRGLARLSRSISAAERARERTTGEVVFEFYAEAGAPEGALYVNGELVGYLPGVTRL